MYRKGTDLISEGRSKFVNLSANLPQRRG